MNKKTLVLTAFLCVFSALFAQNQADEPQKYKINWSVDFNTFLDNMEFRNSTYANGDDGTPGGVNFIPQAALKWDKNYGIFAGANLLKEFGTSNVIDKATSIAYFKAQINENHDITHTFYAGVFPRAPLLSHYSDFLFWRQRTYYMPVIQGLFYQFGYKKTFANAWVDWNGKPDATTHESFFAGLSAHTEYRNFFADAQGYYFHFANTKPETNFNVCDDGQALFRAGYNLLLPKQKLNFTISGGILAGYECERNVGGESYHPIGFVGNFKIEYKNIGIDNSLYAGAQRLRLYQKFGSQLYFANPFLQGKSYLLTDIYWKPFRSRAVNGKLACDLHFSEGQVFLEQVFTLQVSLNGASKKNIQKNY